ncbi:hypothetical protein [Kitasatospora sp. NPDC097643]|uniref:hypothetical protein n=1 Tax=Kitasatospora sp. NPDC097643 TaxID=3157230 RepID=UPI0033208C1F
MVNETDCEHQLFGIKQDADRYRQVEAGIAATQKELDRLTAMHAPAAEIAFVQGELSDQLDQLEQISREGQAAVDEFRGECGGHHLPVLPWE